MKNIQKIKEFFSKPLEENQPQFKKGDKVTYLGHPGEITAVNKEMTGDITYSVAYNKGNGRTKASNIHPKSGAINPLKEVSETEYKVAGRPVTINKNNTEDQTKWTVTFIQNNKTVPYADVLANITPKPNLKEAKGKYKIAYAGKGFYGITNGGKIEGEYSKEEAQKKANEKNKLHKTISEILNGTLDIEEYKAELRKLEEPYLSDKEALATIQKIYTSQIAGLNSIAQTLKEAKEEDKVDTITMDIPLFLRMLEYSREDASQDMDLHDVTEKANKLGKERGILSMDDYEEIVGAAEGASKEELNEAYVPSNIKEFAKRRGVSSLVNKVAGWVEKVGKSITGGTAIGYGYNTLILDIKYQSGEIRINIPEETITLFDEPVYDFRSFERVFIDGQDNNLEEGEEEQLSFISKARAKSSLRQFLSGKRDDGMGKFDAIVYGIDADDKKHQIKYYNDLQKYEKFALGDNPNIKEGMGGQLDEPFFIQVSVRDARKALDMFDDMYRNSNIKTYGSDVYAADTPEDIYDFFYDLNSNGIEVLDANVEDDESFYDSEYEKTLRETIKFIKENNPKATKEEVIDELKEIKKLGEQLNEELCEKGKRYIAARQAAGEKSSAYLSGRGVKVCKGSIEWPKKGKKKK